MSTHRHFDKICYSVLAFILILTLFFVNADQFGIQRVEASMGYETRLFDTSAVHTIDIVMDDWDDFISTCTDEEYSACSVVIDGEAYKNVAIRAKGNTSLTQVQSYGNDRYSFKIEFDHYDSSNSYYGLDKLCLNNIVQDNTYMKDYLTYQLMNEFGAVSPLCSYTYITVNGEDWGLYLAVEGVEESFLQRNYGSDYGELYKPDSSDLGGDDVSLIYTDDEYDSYSNIFDNAKTDVTESDQDRLIASLKKLNENEDIEEVVDVETVIRYFVVHNFVLNFDSYTGSMIHNYYLYENDGQLSMIPWDYNLAFGGFQSASDAAELVNYPIDTPVSGNTVDSRPMLAWIFNNEEYTELYHTYFAEFIDNFFESGSFSEMIDSVKKMISPYVESDPTKFCTYEEFETGVDTLKEFCLLRAESVSGQLDGTIGSTSETQADQSGFIDAGEILISDMGSMGQTKGGDSPASVPGDNAKDMEAFAGDGEEALPGNDAESLPENSGEIVPGNADETFAGNGGEPFSGNDAESLPENSGEVVPGNDSESLPENSGEIVPGNDSESPPGNGGEVVPGNDSESLPGNGGESFPGNADETFSENDAEIHPAFDEEMSGDTQKGAMENHTALLLFGISAGILLIGLIFAFAYKKR